jgi:hypothetical protein
MYICSILTLYLDENIAKNHLTANQYTSLCSAIDYRNKYIKDHYKSMITDSKLSAIHHFRRVLQRDLYLGDFQKMVKFSATCIDVDDDGEFYQSRNNDICINNFSKFSVFFDEFRDEGWEDSCEK